ncbi:MAG TPA: hypothetical protein VD970_07495, partial [Acetobacteraceae bacterium]|nr:hypothetical protein [Acetobacteraceae bacterium]
IHLVRRKVARTALSDAFALATGQWKLTAPEQRVARRITLERAALLAQVGMLRRQVAMARGWLHGLDVVEMRYEELLDADSPSWRSFAAACGAPVRRIETRYVKAIPDPAAVLANAGDVADLLDRDLDDPAWDRA